jgi:PAS domain S-box-containing protein
MLNSAEWKNWRNYLFEVKIMVMKSSLQMDYRCACGKLLFRGLVSRSYVETKCSRCGKLNFIEGIGATYNPNRFAVLTTPKGKIIKISHSIEDTLGYNANELTEKNISEIFMDEATVKSDRIFSRKIIGKKYLRLDGVCRKRNGERVDVSICYQYFPHNGGELLLRVIDIVPVVEKDLLREADFDFAYFCDVVTETDEDGNIVYLDRNLEKIMGFKPEDLIGMNVEQLLLNDEKDWRAKNYKMLRAKKQAYRTIPGYKIKDKSGTLFEQEVYCTPFYDESGNFVGFRNMHWLKKSKADNSAQE